MRASFLCRFIEPFASVLFCGLLCLKHSHLPRLHSPLCLHVFSRNSPFLSVSFSYSAIVYILLDCPLYTKEHPPKFERLPNAFESRQLYANGMATVLSATKGDSWRGQGRGGRRGPGRQLEAKRDEISSRATQCTMDIDT